MRASLLGRWALMSALLAVVLAAAASADVAVLTSGARVNGDIRVTGQGVVIETENGTTTIPAWRVAKVIRNGGHSVALAQFRVEAETASPRRPAAERAPDRAVAEPVRRELVRREPLRPASVLDKRISVDLSDLPMPQAISYLQEITGANFAYVLSELQVDPSNADLRLNDVTLRQVLDLLLEPRGLGWTMRDNVIRIRTAGTDAEMVVRVYDIRDLLLNIEDKQSTTTGRLGGYGGGFGGSGGYGGGSSAQGRGRIGIGTTGGSYRNQGRYGQGGYGGYGGSGGYGGRGGYDGGYGDGYGRSQSQSLNDRAYDLATLITETVQPESWEQPAVVEAGRGIGDRYEDEDEDTRLFEETW